MGRPSEDRCSGIARALAEPLAGTAPTAEKLLFVESNGAWPRSVERHPDPAVAGLAARAAAAGRKLFLIRRPGRRGSEDAPRTVLVADVSPGATRVRRFVIAGPTDLATLRLTDHGGGEEVTRPSLLVCTHGVRDVCCAVEGRGLASAVAETGQVDVWESSHLGGHRFAPTALVLPTGYVYGRLDVQRAVAAAKAAGAGEVEHENCRGRMAWSPAGQIAELAVRERTGLRDADALSVVEVTDRGAVVEGYGARWGVGLEEQERAERPLSCGGALERCAPLVATSVRRIYSTALPH
jgi:hypothetical protein